MTTNSFVSYMILSKFKFGIYGKINSFVIVLGGSEKDHIFWLSEKNGFRIKGSELIKKNSFVIVLGGPKKDQISERKVEDY